MTRKQATIAVRSGLNDDEQYGCVVPPIHLSSTYNFTGFNEPRAHDYSTYLPFSPWAIHCLSGVYFTGPTASKT